MCGIAGTLGSFKPSAIEIMTKSLTHRGPDNQDIYRKNDVNLALGHTRLAILGLNALGNQPMTSRDGRYTITYNGEIYNFPTLKKELKAKGSEFQSETDTEMILEAFSHYGIDSLNLFEGIYAFAIWDHKEKKLIIARDHLGIKPLYYYQGPEGFAFSSELKALISGLPECKKTPNHQALALHLSYLWCPTPHTVFNEFKKLEAGTYLIVQEGKIKEQKQFYSLPQYKESNQIRDEKEAVKEIQTHFKTAIERQLLSDVPVGAFLSGGLDSSAIVSFARNIRQESIPTFTINFKDQSFQNEGFVDDLDYAKAAAKALDVDLKIIDVDSQIALELPKMIQQLDEPQADFAALHTAMIAKLARDNDIKVLLSGTGGDDLFSGYRRHQAISFQKTLSHFPSLIRNPIASLSGKLPTHNALGRRAKKLFENANLSPRDQMISLFHWLSPNNTLDLFKPELSAHMSENGIFSPLRETLKEFEGLSQLDQILALEKTYFLTDHNLNYTDKMTMMYGVEARVPFLDRDLIDCAARIHPSLKIKNGQTKWVLKKAMEPYLPNEIIYRPKTGFGVPLRSWLKNELQDFVMQNLSENSFICQNFFEHKKIQQLIRDNQDGKIDASYPILTLLSLEEFFK
ncbi:MAG: asparagine synthase (glutamine-hydrolyzing), partial [Bacteriovoracaceae bacterium]